MKDYFNLRKSKQLLLTFLATLVGGLSPAWADELTVYDGTKANEYVPVYGYYADAFQKCEFIMPASDLAAMKDATITSMKFYSSSSAISWGAGVFQVFMKEVPSTTMTAYLGTTDAKTIYTGSLSINSGVMSVNFSEGFDYQGGNLLIGVYETTKGSFSKASFLGVAQDTQTAYRGYSTTSLDVVGGSAQYFLPKTTFTFDVKVDGPGLKVKEYKDGETLSFGMVDPGTTKTITLMNPGTTDIAVNIATTGGFIANMSSATIAANKGEQVVTITAPDETANGSITITPTVSTVNPITINLSCVIKDPSKMFEDFNDNQLPEGWENKYISSNASSAKWDYTNGYASYKTSGSTESSALSYYLHSLVSPLVKFEEGEKLLFKVKKDVSYSSYVGYVRVEYTTDGSTWTTAENGTFNDAALSTEWQTKEVTLPATTKKIRFVVAGVGIDDIYGGEYSTVPVMKVTAADYGFGMISADVTTTFTIENSGKSALTGIEITSTDENFSIEDIPASVAPDGTATVTVKMSAANKGNHEATITVTAPEQEPKTFTVSGYVMDTDLFTETFDGNALPDGWKMESGSTYTDYKWTFANGEATGSSRNARLITPSLTVAAGEKMAIEIKKNNTWSCTLPIYVSKDGGEFTLFKTIANADLSDSYKVFFIEGLEEGNYKFRFDGDGIVMNAVNGFHLNMNAPVMEMVSTEAAAFGKVTANASKTYTVKNVGTGELTVNIASDDANFTVEPAQLVITDTPKDFTVTFNYTAGNYGNFTGNITVTPTYNEAAKVTIAASAKALNPEAWDEDFEGGSLPLGWEANNWTIGTLSEYENQTSMALAPSNSTAGTLITPRLTAKENDVLVWDAYFKWADEPLTVEYSNDEKATWTPIVTTYGTASGEKGSSQVYFHKDMSFTAPADGIYYLRFTSTYQNGVDNFNGFKLALKDHDAVISNLNIRSTFTQYTKHQVSVTVKETAGKDETLTAQFFIDGTQYGENVTETVTAGGEKEFIVEVTLNDIVDGNAYFKVFNDDLNLESEHVAITTKAAIILDEDVAFTSYSTGYQDKVALKYTAKQGWNTICVPFALTDADLTAIFGEGYKVYEFYQYKNDELGFRNADRRYAGYPYIVYSENPVTLTDPGYILTYVSFTTEKYDEYNGAKFQGTYAPMEAGDLDGKYGVVPSTGKIQKGGATATMKGFRAYFELPSGANGARLSFTDVTTGITTVMDASELGNDAFNLKGQRVDTPKKGGLYIIGGKKVIVK